MATLQAEWLKIIRDGAAANMDLRRFLEAEIKAWLVSDKRKWMQLGIEYYEDNQDIDRRTRGSKLLPNNKIKNNQYSKLVDQKASYLLARPWTIKTDNVRYSAKLGELFDNRFRRLLKGVGEDSITAGISYVYVYFERGEMRFKRFRPVEILPFWADDDHTELEAFARIYTQEVYEGDRKQEVVRVEFYSKEDIKHYVYENGVLKATELPSSPYLTDEIGQSYVPDRIPLIAFKANSREIPLIKRVKSLQDALNMLYSDCLNRLQEDVHNTVLVIENYEGTDLGEFRDNLMRYGAVKVRTDDSSRGGVSTLTIKVNAENYKTVESMIKKAIIENGRGLDSKDDRMSGTPNQMNIRSMYSDLDLDANVMELEYQASFDDLLYFVNIYLRMKGASVNESDVDIIFNRDILINESEAIDDCMKSVGLISTQTILEQHPWIKDVDKELDRIHTEKQEEVQAFTGQYAPLED